LFKGIQVLLKAPDFTESALLKS